MTAAGGNPSGTLHSPVYSFQAFLVRIVPMNLLGWRVVRASRSMTAQWFDAPQGCSFYRLVPVGDARIVW